MIEYLEVRDTNFNIIGIIDIAQSVIWHPTYFNVGDFEIYINATRANVALLQKDRYITRTDNDEVGIIESIEISNDIENNLMIAASGRYAKSLLDRRLIYQLSGTQNAATILTGNVEANVRKLVSDNAINCTDSNRNMSILELGASAGTQETILDENGNAGQKQVTYQNLLDYTDSFLLEYGLGSKIVLDQINKKLQYMVYKGADRSVDNTEGNEPIIFSQEFDNLLSSDYTYDSTTEKNVALIGGAGEDLDRFYSLLGNSAGLERREIFVDAKSINRNLKADVLQNMYPSGSFVGTTFVVNGTVYANLIYSNDKEVTLNTLQSKFPTGAVSGAKYIVNNITYATQVYGEDNKYVMTLVGYKALLDADGTLGDYMLTDSVYTTLLNTEGLQTLTPLVPTETFDGEIDITNANWIFGRDFELGDIVTVQDDVLGKYINVRISEMTEVQDEDGYKVLVNYTKG